MVTNFFKKKKNLGRGGSVKSIEYLTHVDQQFHYENVNLVALQSVKFDFASPQPCEEPNCFRFKVISTFSKPEGAWTLRKTFDELIALDEVAHRYSMTRAFSKLPDCTLVTITPAFCFEYLTSFWRSFTSEKAIPTVSQILHWFQLDCNASRMITNERSSLLNRPAIGAAQVIKSYKAKDSDELSVNVDECVSIIEWPRDATNKWCWAKKGIQNGLVPVANLTWFNKDSKLEPTKRIPSECSQSSLSESGRSRPVRRQNSKLVLQQNPKLVIKLEGSLTNPVDRNKLKEAGILKPKIFGSPLEEVAQPNGVPLVVEMCTSAIEKHTPVQFIYRQSAAQNAVTNLRTLFHTNSFKTGDRLMTDVDGDSSNQHSVHAIASLLKMYFRELPNPLFTHSFYNEFVTVVESSDPVESAKTVVQRLPPPYFATLRHLMGHLNLLTQKEMVADTKMTVNSMAVVWTPSLVREPDLLAGSFPPTPLASKPCGPGKARDPTNKIDSLLHDMKDPLAKIQKHVALVELFIRRFHDIFPPDYEEEVAEDMVDSLLSNASSAVAATPQYLNGLPYTENGSSGSNTDSMLSPGLPTFAKKSTSVDYCGSGPRYTQNLMDIVAAQEKFNVSIASTSSNNGTPYSTPQAYSPYPHPARRQQRSGSEPRILEPLSAPSSKVLQPLTQQASPVVLHGHKGSSGVILRRRNQVKVREISPPTDRILDVGSIDETDAACPPLASPDGSTLSIHHPSVVVRSPPKNDSAAAVTSSSSGDRNHSSYVAGPSSPVEEKEKEELRQRPPVANKPRSLNNFLTRNASESDKPTPSSSMFNRFNNGSRPSSLLPTFPGNKPFPPSATTTTVTKDPIAKSPVSLTSPWKPVTYPSYSVVVNSNPTAISTPSPTLPTNPPPQTQRHHSLLRKPVLEPAAPEQQAIQTPADFYVGECKRISDDLGVPSPLHDRPRPPLSSTSSTSDDLLLEGDTRESLSSSVFTARPVFVITSENLSTYQDSSSSKNEDDVELPSSNHSSRTSSFSSKSFGKNYQTPKPFSSKQPHFESVQF